MIFSFRLSQLNQAQLKWFADVLSSLGKAAFIVGVLGFFIPSLEIPVNPVKFGLALAFSLTTFSLALIILRKVK